MLIIYFTLAILCAVSLALMEIQIEGPHGWAAKLPTRKYFHPLFRFIPGGNKPVTFYHIFLWTSVFLLPHTAFLISPWTLKSETLLLSFILITLRLEDFFWFVLNPHFRLKKFKPAFVPWHRSWLGPFPVQYYTSFFFWILLLKIYYHLPG